MDMDEILTTYTIRYMNKEWTLISFKTIYMYTHNIYSSYAR